MFSLVETTIKLLYDYWIEYRRCEKERSVIFVGLQSSILSVIMWCILLYDYCNENSMCQERV